MKYFELFAGVGGFGIGIQNAYKNIRDKGGGKQPTKEREHNGGNIIHAETDAEIHNAYNLQRKHIRPESKEEEPQKRRFGATNEPGEMLCGSDGSAPLCVGFSEIDKYASQVLKYHYPEIKNWGDIRAIDARTLPDFELLTGGFPCQTFSIAGKRKGFEDARGTLFFEMARIAKEKKPKYWLAENVKGLVSHDGGKTLRVILATMQEIGYAITYEIINSKNYGVPQNRERIFILGYHIPTICKEIISGGIKKKTDSSAQIIKGFLFQNLLNNLEEVKKLQEIESKDWILGLLILKGIISAGQKKTWPWSGQTLQSLYEKSGNCSLIGLNQLFTKQHAKTGELFATKDSTSFTEENISHSEMVGPWESIELLLKESLAGNLNEPNKSTTLTAISQTTQKETFTYAEMLRTIASFTIHLRSLSSPLWNEVLSDLIIIKENTKYEPITNQNEERIIGRSGFVRRSNLPAALGNKPIIECGFRNGCPPEVFFEPGTNGKDIQQPTSSAIDANYGKGLDDHGARTGIINLEPGANQANRRYDTKGISPTIPTAGGGRHIPMIVGKPNYKTGKRKMEYKLTKNAPTISAQPKSGDRQPKIFLDETN